MKLDYGFVEFYSDKDEMAKSFFKEANNRDFLGLRKMNIRISNVLFPFGNTLMPNLVYFYYLNAIYHVYKERNGKIPSKAVVDKYEKLISQKICINRQFEKKGFFNDANSRAYGKYKSNMERMHFFDKRWKAHKEHEKTALEYLRETARFRFVEAVISCNQDRIGDSEAEPCMPAGWNAEGTEWYRTDDKRICFKPDKLEDTERLDFIRRVVQPYETEIPKYSVFANIVMHHAMVTNHTAKMENIFKTEWMDEYNTQRKINSIVKNGRGYDFSGIRAFDQLHEYFTHIRQGQERSDLELKNRKKDYEIALVYSKLQLIAKLAYNICLFEKIPDRQKEYLESIKKELGEIHNYDTLTYMTSKFTGKEYDIFLGNKPGDSEHDASLESSFAFVKQIAECIRMTDGNRSEDELVNQVKQLVREREKEVMGDSSILDSGIYADKGLAGYVDTFRWQYRPEYAKEEAGESYVVEEESTIQEEEKEYIWKYGEEKNTLKTMSASYYIYELFFEPYESVGGDTHE